MTIGIVAFGANAGAGVLAALDSVERVGRGAVGGFVSLAAITENGRLVRSFTQSGGRHALTAGADRMAIETAPLAGLISSGPNRPEPLSAFVSADPAVGIVTGHRMPQTETESGKTLNDLVLNHMRSGLDPQAAIDAVILEHPEMDAGFVAITCDQRIGLGNMPSVLRRGDQGHGIHRAPDGLECVATVHNAIHPHRVIATLANEMAMDVMHTRHMPVTWIVLRAGLGLHLRPQTEVHVDIRGDVTEISYAQPNHLSGRWSIGLGDQVPVLRDGKRIGWLGYEPFMTLVDGIVTTIDGEATLRVPVLDHIIHSRLA